MTDYFPTDEELDAEVDYHLDALDRGWDAGYEDYEPSPYDGTYSEM